MEKTFKFHGVEVSHLFETCGMIGGEARGHNGLFADFYVSKPGTADEQIDMWLARTKINSSALVVMGALRRRSHDDFEKAIHKAVSRYLAEKTAKILADHFEEFLEYQAKNNIVVVGREPMPTSFRRDSIFANHKEEK